jgi:hypothetical protein
VREGRVRLARRAIVEAVVAAGKVRGADREPREAQAEALAAEELPQQRFALGRRQSLLDQPGRRVGDRRAEAHHFLEAPACVHLDADRLRIGGTEGDVRLARQQSRAIPGADPRLRDERRAACGRRRAGRPRRRNRDARKPGRGGQAKDGRDVSLLHGAISLRDRGTGY